MNARLKGWWNALYVPESVRGMMKTLVRFFRHKATLNYPEEVHVPRRGYRGEHRLKKDELGRMKCVACMMCQTACPAECIHIEGGASPWPDRDKVPVVFTIDLLKCIYCGMCEEACPCDAIELTPTFTKVCSSREEKVYDLEKLLSL
jgi:NADH-quinone oxidoreductase subunit I